VNRRESMADGDLNDDAEEKSTGALVREAIDEAKDLVRLEVALAKTELEDQLEELRTGAVALAAAGVLVSVGLSMLALALVLAIAPTSTCALVVGALLLGLGVVAGVMGYAKLPKKPLDRTRRRLQTDVEQLKERVA
jgi:uncharacterized membrane protein YqjE